MIDNPGFDAADQLLIAGVQLPDRRVYLFYIIVDEFIIIDALVAEGGRKIFKERLFRVRRLGKDFSETKRGEAVELACTLCIFIQSPIELDKRTVYLDKGIPCQFNPLILPKELTIFPEELHLDAADIECLYRIFGRILLHQVKYFPVQGIYIRTIG